MMPERQPSIATLARIGAALRAGGRRGGVALAGLIAGLAIAPLAAEDPPKGTAFREEFDRLDSGFWFVSDGWTNGSHQNCDWSSRAVEVRDGLLTLSFLPGGEGPSARHLCGEIQSRAIYHHGTYEARIRTARGSGLNAAFFTYIGPVHAAPHDEIDVEILTRDTGRVSLNTIVDGTPHHGTEVSVDPPADQAFHTYAFAWDPDGIRWFIDGREVHRAAGTLPATPQKIYLSHWGSDRLTDWMGPFTVPDAPMLMEIDWVAFTPLGAPCQFPASIACQIR